MMDLDEELRAVHLGPMRYNDIEEIYPAIMEEARMYGGHADALTASSFYNLGYNRGIRRERQRRKRLMSDLAADGV